MRIQVASDLHLELLNRYFPDFLRIDHLRAPEVDVLVLAGDIHNDLGAIEKFAHWPHPVLYVPGNHEYYGCTVLPQLHALRQSAANTAVKVLARDEWVMGGVRFLGCTLWTDYDLEGASRKQAVMQSCEDFLADHRAILGVNTPTQRFRAQDAYELHLQDRAWLEQKLEEPFHGSTVVITHHAPSPGSIHARFRADACNGGFVSHLEHLVKKADLWIHGHVHDSFDYTVGNCRVVVNPGSYASNLRSAFAPVELEYENPLFDPAMVIEIGAVKSLS